MPKGGGALRGIGEKLSINPATGTASLAVPLPLPPGRLGFGPSVSLTYGSGGGLGPFGIGWALDVPRISRGTEKGLPSYGRGDTADLFVLSGAEDLVPAQRFDGQAWHPEVRSEGSYTVTRFVPRQEGPFLRVEQWLDEAAGDVFWKSISKDNVASLYGATAESRIADPEHPERIFAWLLCEVRNDRGDMMRYRYKAEDDAGLPECAAERNRRAGQAIAQRYLKRIEYGVDAPVSSTSGQPGFHFELVVDYGEHDSLNPTPAEAVPWSYRADPSSDFRAGFEVRTRRLARRLLVFHRFDDLGPAPVLTRSLDLTYDQDPAGARLIEIVERGRDGAGTASARPKLRFGYSRATPDLVPRALGGDALDNLPEGVDGARFRFVDLYEEAAPGVLVDRDDAWLFKRNSGDGHLEALEMVAEKPNWARLGAGAELAQLEADGRLYATRRGEPAGYSARDDDGAWEPFRPFAQDATIDWGNPALRHADLDGDGRAEAILLSDEVIQWFRNRGRAGYDEPRRAGTGADEEAGPACVLSNRLESIFLADMTGDGLSDIVRIRNGEACYWPNRGYGRFGAKITMDRPPWFDQADLFDPARLRLGDIDGSGTTDLLYLGRHASLWWRNEAGNGWSAGVPVALGFPTLDAQTRVELVDLLGTGTSCLVWSSARPHDQARPLRFIDLQGAKPYLLTEVDNGAGARTAIEYGTSGAQYRADRRAGRPWRTKLSFPVHLVRRITHQDLLSGNSLVSEYHYRHGYYDRAEREFRGFAMVEQRDSETVASPLPHRLPPVVTRSWFHTGAWHPGAVSDVFADEYYAGTERLPDSVIEGAATPREQREACRALRGQIVRQEVYAEDGSASAGNPYLVTETRCVVRRLQPAGAGARDYGVFVAWPVETLSQHLERDAGDPRITHELILDRDPRGNPLRTLKAAYPRRLARRPSGAGLGPVADAQGKLLATIAEAGFAEDVGDSGRHRHSVPVWSAEFELTGVAPQGTIFRLDEARQSLDALPPAVPFHAAPGSAPARRLVGAAVHLSRTDATADADPDNDDALVAVETALGSLDPLALPYRTYALALTDALLNQTLGTRLSSAAIDLAAEGYSARSFTVAGANGAAITLDGWWAGSPLESFASAGFYSPVKVQDPFGAVWKIDYDPAWMLPTKVVDPKGDASVATIDYRHMAPAEVIDPNGNRHFAAYDGFGRLAAQAVAGKAGSGDGDSLADPTVTFTHVENEWSDNGRPNYVHARSRETHGDPGTRWLETRVYSDGFGRELATKTRVRAGTAHFVAGGVLQSQYSNPRWVGSGRIVYDNKGNPLRRYEPYFSVTADHEEDDALRLWGVSAEVRYDPLSRPIETHFPDGTSEKKLFGAWRQESWDRNDTLSPSAPWIEAAVANPTGTKAERARALAEAHAGTPEIAHLDTLGRAILTEQDDQQSPTCKTLSLLDIQGHQRELWDANGNRALLQAFDMAGRPIHAFSNDAGESFALAAADGQPRHHWSPRGYYFRHDYDRMRRPTAIYQTDPANAATVSERIVYGEAAPNAAAHNLIGRPWLTFDGAGALRMSDYDFKGNAVAEQRFVFTDPVAAADWSALPADALIDGWMGVQALFDSPFATGAAFDAHDRLVAGLTPDGSETRYAYDDGGALTAVTVHNLPGRSAPLPVIADIGYDAKGQRAWIAYGNGVAGFYSYDRATDRLREMLATRDFQLDGHGVPIAAGSQPAPLQRLIYVYDPVGNIVEIEDLAQDEVFHEGLVAPRRLYEYDALYRLVAATGREHRSQTMDGAQDRAPAAVAQAIPATTDMQNLRGYTQRYAYDPVGNITRMRHIADSGWTRDYVYDYQRAGQGLTSPFPAASHPGNSNRLFSTQLSGAASPDLHEHDAAGNILALPSIAAIDWDARDRPTRMRIGTVDAHYRYDASGERVRKFVDKGNVKEERLYLGTFEIRRRWTGGTLDLRVDTLHVADDARRVLLIETGKDAAGAALPNRAPVARFQLDDHLQSACLEVDELGAPISYEEFHPFGTTALHWKNSGLSHKRYRHTGMERDVESGLHYHSARYYLPWLGRWLSADPTGVRNGIDLFAYVDNSPVVGRDSNGLQIDKRPVDGPFIPTIIITPKKSSPEPPLNEVQKLFNLALKDEDTNQTLKDQSLKDGEGKVQFQKFTAKVAGSAADFIKFKNEFMTRPQNITNNSWATYALADLDKDKKLSKGDRIDIDVWGPDDGNVRVAEVSNNILEFSASFKTLEGHPEAGAITFTGRYSVDSKGVGTIEFEIMNITRVSLPPGATLFLGDGPTLFSRGAQADQWKEVLANFGDLLGKKISSAEVEVLRASWNDDIQNIGSFGKDMHFDITQGVQGKQEIKK